MAAVNLTLQGDRVRTIADSLTDALQQRKNLQFTGLEYYVKCPRQKCKKQPSNKFSMKDSSNSSDTIVIVLISVTATVITVLILENIMCAINFSRKFIQASTFTLPITEDAETLPVKVSNVDELHLYEFKF